MTKAELFTTMREHGYSQQEFFEDLEADEKMAGTIQQLIRLMESGETVRAWEEIERLHDEFIYFGLYDDDEIVVQMATEATMQ